MGLSSQTFADVLPPSFFVFFLQVIEIRPSVSSTLYITSPTPKTERELLYLTPSSDHFIRSLVWIILIVCYCCCYYYHVSPYVFTSQSTFIWTQYHLFLAKPRQHMLKVVLPIYPWGNGAQKGDTGGWNRTWQSLPPWSLQSSLLKHYSQTIMSCPFDRNTALKFWKLFLLIDLPHQYKQRM